MYLFIKKKISNYFFSFLSNKKMRKSNKKICPSQLILMRNVLCRISFFRLNIIEKCIRKKINKYKTTKSNTEL